jgi:hypothetical protein
MENMGSAPTPGEAAAAIADAEAGRASLAHHVLVPRLFFVSLGAAVAVQIGTTAAGLAGAGTSPGLLVAGGIAVFFAVAAAQLARFRSLNGVWLGGLLSRVVGGTATAASASYAVALAAGTWAAFASRWWLVLVCALAGGAAYAWSGRTWMRKYHSEPGAHSRGESAAWLAAMVLLGVVLLVLLVSHR